MYALPTLLLLFDKEVTMGSAYKEIMHVKHLYGHLTEGRHLENTRKDRRIILKLISEMCIRGCECDLVINWLNRVVSFINGNFTV
jgi:hypothetical protein